MASTSITISELIASSTPRPTPIPDDRDPYLDYQPAFAYSLPVQILLIGIIFTLASVLLIHLIFTAPYHWPLAKLNYALQLSGVVSLLLSLATSITVILGDVHATSRQWPYMLNYVATEIPLPTWPLHSRGWWYVLNALMSGLAHITHIQYLTLLYPSSLEVRLIFLLLGPLALLSSASCFIDMSPNAMTVMIGESMRNICNSALAILFTIALCIWGFGTNRQHAWRTDGGTAIFGAGALLLAFFSTALNLFQIAIKPPLWVPGLVWAVVLWQSFLGWWWWVGSGVPTSPSSKLHGKRKKTTTKRKVRRPNKEGHDEQGGATEAISTTSARSRIRSGIINAGGAFRRRGIPATSTIESTSTAATIEPRRMLARDRNSIDSARTDAAASMASSPFQVSGPNATSTQTQNTSPSFFVSCWRRLQNAHHTATRLQAIDTVQRRVQAYGPQGARADAPAGWGLGSFALREREERRMQEEGSFVDEEHSPKEITRPNAAVLKPGVAGNGLSWWGPLSRWRLKDASTYS